MNRKLFTFFILLFLAVTLVSCKKNTPKDIAYEWLNDFFHLDYDAAKKISTDDTKNLLSQVQQLASMIPDSTKKEYKKISITIKSVQLNGTKATVFYTASDNPTLEQPLNLVNIKGQWLVLYTKDDQPDPSSANTITDPSAADSLAPAPSDNGITDTSHGR